MVKKLLASAALLLLPLCALAADTITDVLTPEAFGSKKGGYGVESLKYTSPETKISYTGAFSNPTGFMQFNNVASKYYAGVITTANPKEMVLKNVRINWYATPDTTEVAMNVFVSEAPYTKAKELYLEESAGTMAGALEQVQAEGDPETAEWSTFADLAITGEGDNAGFMFCGIRPDNNTVKIASIELTWERTQPLIPSPEMTFDQNTNEILFTPVEGETYYYTINSGTYKYTPVNGSISLASMDFRDKGTVYKVTLTGSKSDVTSSINIVTKPEANLKDNVLTVGKCGEGVVPMYHVVLRDESVDAFSENEYLEPVELDGNTFKSVIVFAQAEVDGKTIRSAITEFGLTSAVSELEAETSSAIYDLEGRKVIGTPAPGLYLINGKKVLIKK